MESVTSKTRMTRSDRFEQLLDCAEKLFIERGFEKTALGDVATAASVSRPTVYEHFGSKENLYVECVRRAREQYEAEAAAAVANASDHLDEIRRGGDAYFSMIERNPDRWIVFFGGPVVPLTGELGERLTDLRFKTVALFTEQLRAIAPDQPTEGLESFAHAISGVGEQMGRWWIRNPHVLKTTVLDYYTAFVWTGLSPFAAD